MLKSRTAVERERERERERTLLVDIFQKVLLIIKQYLGVSSAKIPTKIDYIKFLLKMLIALSIALLFLHVICGFYYNISNLSANKTKTTFYVWSENSNYIQMLEGFGIVKFDNYGFNNMEDYNKSKKIDILLMGSSHMEAAQVFQADNTAAIVNKLFKRRLYLYNIGINSHTLLHCINNLHYALNFYKPKYVVIETSKLNFQDEEILKAINGNLSLSCPASNPIKRILRKNRYIRLISFQLENIKNTNQKGLKKNTTSIIANKILLNQLLNKVHEESVDAQVIPIIVYHSHISLNRDKNDYTDKINNKNVEIFRELCLKNDIIFVDMTSIFVQNYKKYKILPHGFNNTVPGEGHLNKYGHKMLAKEIYKLIDNMENSKNGIQ